MKERLELIHRPARDGAGARLCAPAVGLFTRAAPAGAALTPGAAAGVLLVLGRAHELVVPAGVEGRVVSAPPPLVLQPVGYGDALYELAALAGAASAAESARAEAARGPALRAPYGGRFFSRPAPGDPPFVAPGDALEPGRTVGLIEVMKTFTEVRYEAGLGLPARARVLRVAAGDGAEVLAGDVLLELAPA